MGSIGDSKSTLHTIRLQNLNNIIIGTLNINSLANKFDFLKHVVNRNLDVLILKETINMMTALLKTSLPWMGLKYHIG